MKLKLAFFSSDGVNSASTASTAVIVNSNHLQITKFVAQAESDSRSKELKWRRAVTWCVASKTTEELETGIGLKDSLIVVMTFNYDLSYL